MFNWFKNIVYAVARTKKNNPVYDRLNKIYNAVLLDDENECHEKDYYTEFDTKLGKRWVILNKMPNDFYDIVLLMYCDYDGSPLFYFDCNNQRHDDKNYNIKFDKDTVDELSAFLAIYEIEQLLGINDNKLTMLDLMAISGKTRQF